MIAFIIDNFFVFSGNVTKILKLLFLSGQGIPHNQGIQEGIQGRGTDRLPGRQGRFIHRIHRARILRGTHRASNRWWARQSGGFGWKVLQGNLHHRLPAWYLRRRLELYDYLYIEFYRSSSHAPRMINMLMVWYYLVFKHNFYEVFKIILYDFVQYYSFKQAFTLVGAN